MIAHIVPVTHGVVLAILGSVLPVVVVVVVATVDILLRMIAVKINIFKLMIYLSL